MGCLRPDLGALQGLPTCGWSSFKTQPELGSPKGGLPQRVPRPCYLAVAACLGHNWAFPRTVTDVRGGDGFGVAVQDVGTHGTSSWLREAGGAEGCVAAIYILKLNHQKKCGVKASLFLMHYLGSQGCKASAIRVCIPQLLWGKCWGGEEHDGCVQALSWLGTAPGAGGARIPCSSHIPPFYSFQM